MSQLASIKPSVDVLTNKSTKAYPHMSDLTVEEASASRISDFEDVEFKDDEVDLFMKNSTLQ